MSPKRRFSDMGCRFFVVGVGGVFCRLSKRIKNVRYIDIKTGEITGVINKFVNTTFDDEKGYLFWNRKSGTRLFDEVRLPKDFSFTEKGMFYDLTLLIFADTNMLAYRGNDNTIKPCDTEYIADYLGVSLRHAQRFMRKLIKHEVVAKVTVEVGKVKQHQYYVNPLYAFDSRWLSLNLYLIFQKQLDRFLPEWVKNEFAKKILKEKSDSNRGERKKEAV